MRSRRFIDLRQLAALLMRYRFVLLGEKHDNPHHHRRQAQLLHQLVSAGRRPVVAWEMITAGQREQLAAFLARPRPDPAELGPAVGWHESGWPAWRIYQPIAEVALSAGLALQAAGVSRETLKQTLQAASRPGGRKKRPGRRAQRSDLERRPPGRAKVLPELPEPSRRALERAIGEAHCGHLGRRVVEKMTAMQRLRDALMAERVLEAARPSAAADDPARRAGRSVVLIAGNGHARQDYGVPFYLRRRASARSISVAMVEVRRGVTAPASYAEAVRSRPPFDVLWFSVRVDDEDPCERFRRQLKHIHRHSG